MDEHRQLCSAQGILPRRWIEKALMQLPKDLKSVAFNFKSPEGEEDLTESEYVILLQTLFQEQNPTLEMVNQGTRKEPLVGSSFGRKTNVAIPSSLDPVSTLKNPKDNVLPLESLELHGANVTHAVLKELCYWSVHASHKCRLRSLLVSGADLDCGVTDPLHWLSLSGPLMRSLRKLTVKNCKSLKIVDPCTWALFFGTIPLESLIIYNSGFDCNDISFLCQVLCANETPSLNLKRLDLRIGTHKLSLECSRTQYSDPNVVHITRCLSKLADLDSIRLDCLTTDQRLQLYEEWKAIKGSSQCFVESDELSTYLHLAIDLHSEEEKSMKEVVRFEQCSAVTQHDSSIDKTPSGRAHAEVSLSNVCDQRKIQFRNHTSHQRKPIPTSSKTTLNPSQPEGIEEQSHRSVLDKSRTRYSPSNPPRRSSVQQSQCHKTTRQTKSPNNSLDNARESCKTRRKRQVAKSRRNKGPAFKSRSSLVVDQSESHSNQEKSASSEEYDLEEELRCGPLHGCRTVFREDTKETPNLMEYANDGFIRPDNEMVYTTSASEREIGRELDTLEKQCEIIIISTSDSTLEEAIDQESWGTPSPTSLADNITQPLVVRRPDQNSREQNFRDPTNELPKELMELQPFYYDKRREKFKPGKIFSHSTTASVESSGVRLRSGKRVGIEGPSTIVPTEDTTIINGKLETASGSKSVSCEGQRINKSSLATTDMGDVSTINLETSAMDRDLNHSCPRHSKDRKRQSREALRLQPWSWDPMYDKCPPNYRMYMTSKKKRRGRKNTH